MVSSALQIRPTTRLLILEASSSLGGAWSRERVYGGLRTHNALGTLELPGLAMAGENTTAEGYLVGEDVAEYLHAFARKFGLLERMRCDSRVQNIARDVDGVTWTVEIEGGQPLKARKIIVATGLTSRPLLPEVDDEKADIERFHSVELHRREQWLKRDDVESVVIYGGSKSAYDAVFMAAEMGKRVEWVIRSSGAGTPVRVLSHLPTSRWVAVLTKESTNSRTKPSASTRPTWRPSVSWHRCIPQCTTGTGGGLASCTAPP